MLCLNGFILSCIAMSYLATRFVKARLITKDAVFPIHTYEVSFAGVQV
jgi:hypothetical protein